MSYVFTDKVKSTVHIESVTLTEEITAGQFVTLGKLNPDGESRSATKAKTIEEADAFVVPDPISYNDTHFDYGAYVVKPGETVRAYVFERGDYYSVTTDLVTGGAKPGDALAIGDNGLGFKKADSGRGIAQLVNEEAHGFAGTVEVISFR